MASNEENRVDRMEQQLAELMENQLKLSQQWIRVHQEMQEQQQEMQKQTQQLVSAMEKFEQAIKQFGKENPTPPVFHPEIEFPKFNGENPRIWLMKCRCYFELIPMPDRQKISMAMLHMEGTSAFNWYANHVERRAKKMTWDEFEDSLLRRFENWEGENMVGKFNKLKQVGTVEEYICEFEELQAYMVSKFKNLDEKHFVYSFIGGLREDIAVTVELFNPDTLISTMQLAKKQEHLLHLTKTY